MAKSGPEDSLKKLLAALITFQAGTNLLGLSVKNKN
jgi:hypothetical protein